MLFERLKILPIRVIFSYFIFMRCISQIVACFLVISILSIQLVPLFDDPDHLMTAEPDCPICLAYETQVLLTTVDVAEPVLNLIFIISESQPVNFYDHPFISIFTIRAPPEFSLL